MVKGVDISTLLELEKHKTKYFDNGTQEKLEVILSAHGVNSVRLRLWNSPFDSDGVPYGGGSDDLVTVIEIAKRCRRVGMSFLLDFHYSDFWADTGRQMKPKAWRGYDLPRLCEAVKHYTVSVLEYLEAAGVCPDMIQPGNEISGGILWPDGKFPEYEAACKLFEAAILGIRYAAPGAEIILHTAAEPEHEVYTGFLDTYGSRLDYDIIGVSYFPYKKTYGMNVLRENIERLSGKYGKKVCIVETAMPYTTQDYASQEKLGENARKGMATKNARMPENSRYDISPKGQLGYMKDLVDMTEKACGCIGFYYWEPAWIPVVGSGWATSASLRYLGVKEPCGNEWANQALFDYDGNALPALRAFEQDCNI
mgnify:FL=1